MNRKGKTNLFVYREINSLNNLESYQSLYSRYIMNAPVRHDRCLVLVLLSMDLEVRLGLLHIPQMLDWTRIWGIWRPSQHLQLSVVLINY